MTSHIEAQALTTFEVTNGGERLRLNAQDADGAAVSLSLPAECLAQMVMSLPRMAQAALQQRHQDNSLRIVYPAATWKIEQGQGADATFIITVGTPDGFEVSFGLNADTLAQLEQSLGAAAQAPLQSTIFN